MGSPGLDPPLPGRSMPITLNCSCGKILRIADEHAGKRVKCPACQGILSSASAAPVAAPPPARSPSPKPAPPAFEVVEDEPPPVVRGPSATRARADDDDDDGHGPRKAERTADAPRSKPAFRKRAEDDDDDEPRPRKKKRRRVSRRAGALGGPDAWRRLGFIAGGALVLVVGVALAWWGNSGEGRGATRLLIFGALLAIGGLISVVQGVTGNLPDPDEE
jgi:hypothetical protein